MKIIKILWNIMINYRNRFRVLVLLVFSMLITELSAEEQNIYSDELEAVRKLDVRCDSLKHYIDLYFVSTDSLEGRTISKIERETIKQVFAQVLDMYNAVDVIYDRYSEIFDENPDDKYAQLLKYYTYFISYDLGLYLIQKTESRKHYEILLDEPQYDYGILQGSYGDLKTEIMNYRYVRRITYKYNDVLNIISKIKDDTKLFSDIKQSMDKKYNYLKTTRVGKGEIYFLRNFADFFMDFQEVFLMPIQKETLSLIGDTRLTRRHHGLISHEQCDSIYNILEPGDILFERKEWYLSNIGLPGFWPHAAMFIGDSAKLSQWSEDNEIKNFTTFPDYLKINYPEAWKAYMELDSNSYNMSIMEAIGEGVVWHSIYESVGASDYFCALRTKFAKKDIALAIENAFKYYGRNYDFNFNFMSDNELVCSELVYKSYEKDEHKEGMEFELESIMGRLTLSPNAMLTQYCQAQPNKQLDFVTFYDANEPNGYAFSNSLDMLCKSTQRPRWDYDSLEFENDLLEQQISSEIEPISESYFHAPVNSSLFLNYSLMSNFSNGKKIINYLSLNFWAGGEAKLHGIEIGLVWNHYSENVAGLQISGIMNSAIENSHGIQTSGLLNAVGSDYYGLQLSGAANYTGKSLYGFQASALSNNCDDLYGIQLGGLLNATFDKSYGLQLALFNISMDMRNTQIGVFNTAATMSGLQLGLFNGAFDVNSGIQLGLVNFSKENSGYPIGLYSYVDDQKTKLSFWTDEMSSLNIGIKSGNENLYNKISYGYFIDNQVKHSLSWELGHDFTFNNYAFVMGIGAGIRHLLYSDKNIFEVNDILYLTAQFEYSLYDGINVFISPTLNYLVSKNNLEIPEQWIINSTKNEYYEVLWIGARLGINY